MKLHIEEFLNTLPIMLKGMAGIFVVTAIIVIVITLLIKISENQNGQK